MDSPCTTLQAGWAVTLYSQPYRILRCKYSPCHLRQEQRKDVREVNNPPPQPEDPDRALDPGLEEDPDVFVELIDMTFYQLSCDDAMVAIIADYPGLLPASHVSKTGVPTSEKVEAPTLLTCDMGSSPG